MAALTHKMSPLEQVRRAKGVTVSIGDRQFSNADQSTLRQILTGKYEYMKDPLFGRADARRKLFRDDPFSALVDANWYRPAADALGAEATDASFTPSAPVLLTAQQERQLFLQYNYCRYRVCKLRARIRPGRITPATGRALLDWHRKAQRLRDQIAHANLALVLAMAKRKRVSEVDWADLISEGNMALLRAADKFDVSRGFKFSTYACRAILKAFSRAGIAGTKYRNLFPTDFDPALERSDYQKMRRDEVKDECADQVKQILRKNRAELTDIEQAVIRHRFAIDRTGRRPADGRPLTLVEVGKIIGLTKERVRQIQKLALDKIRRSLEIEYLR